jgi:hypothetical protein
MMTIFEDPRLDKPAVRAKGTVMPSAKPMVMSRMIAPDSEWRSEAAWVGIGASLIGSAIEVGIMSKKSAFCFRWWEKAK